MRILFLTPFLPDPVARHGGGSYLGSLAVALSGRAELGLLHIGHPQERTPRAPEWKWHRTLPYQGRPKPNGQTLHSLRMLWRWRQKPLLAAKYWHPRMPALIAEALQQFKPSAVLVELAQMAQYLPFLRDVPTILTDHEAGQPVNASTGMGKFADRRDTRMWQRYLRSYYPMAGALQALTEEDAASLSRQLGREVHLRPPTLRVPITPCKPGSAPARALFLGDYAHQPNPEAAERLVVDVLPRIRSVMPDAELWLAGANSHLIEELGEHEGVHITGFVDSLTELLAQARVVLAPLWSGAGFRVKNATALAHGLPVVTNALGARGCGAPPPALQIAETSESLAAATLHFLQSPDLADDAGGKAHEWAQSNLAADAVAARQIQRIAALRS